jgi:hypothetical protein
MQIEIVLPVGALLALLIPPLHKSYEVAEKKKAHQGIISLVRPDY